MAEEPMKLSAGEFLRVELLENRLYLSHDRWNFAFWDFLIRPVSTGENFYRKFNSINYRYASSSGLEIIVKILGFNHVFEHSFNLVDRVVTTFNSKFIDHLLLCPVR